MSENQNCEFFYMRSTIITQQNVHSLYHWKLLSSYPNHRDILAYFSGPKSIRFKIMFLMFISNSVSYSILLTPKPAKTVTIHGFAVPISSCACHSGLGLYNFPARDLLFPLLPQPLFYISKVKLQFPGSRSNINVYVDLQKQCG